MQDTEYLWFAMKAPFQRELKAKEWLESKQVRCFVPTQTVMSFDASHKRVVQTRPVISNLVFVYATRSQVQDCKTQLPYLQYYPNRVHSGKGAVTVTVSEMERFMLLMQHFSDRALFFSPEEVNLAKGTPVRIHGGLCDGQTGVLLKVRGGRSKRFVVSVSNFLTAAFMVECEYVEELKSN